MGNCSSGRLPRLCGEDSEEFVSSSKDPYALQSRPKKRLDSASAAVALSKKIDEQLVRDYRKMEKVIKLLLLGPSQSGKSTVLKQIRIIHLNGFSSQDLLEYRPLIFSNIRDSMLQVISGIRQLNISLGVQYLKDIAMLETTLEFIDIFGANPFSQEIQQAIKRVWSVSDVQEVYERRSDTNVMDCAKYFLDSISRVCESDYVPHVDDILRSRQETIGVAELCYEYKKLDFRIYDVGGHKRNRRRWINMFDNCTSVFFIFAISEYDKFTRNDSSNTPTNCLIETIHLFRWIGNNDLFLKIEMILFLNKKDIFAEKIEKVPLTVCFPNYRRPNDYINATEYIQQKFESQIDNKNKMIYTHLTCATDTTQVEFLLNSITDMIIAENFKQTGVI